MLTRTIFGLVIVSFIIVTLTPVSHAVSDATVLFLRIASGARAAGMGEAFVAVADDATATHWNPAGLGAYPLADSWKDAHVPIEYRPLREIAVLRKETNNNLQSYEFWALSEKGLIRYDNYNWYEGEIFSLRSNEKVQHKVSAFFGIDDDELLAPVVAKVAEFNSEMTLQELKDLHTNVMSDVPNDYSRFDEMNEAFDSLITVYNECRINWERTTEIIDRYHEGMKDSVLTESECERINFAVQRSKSRFVLEVVTIPFGALFEGEFTTIASNEFNLMVGTTKGLYYYTGSRWLTLNDIEGLPSTSITCLEAYSGTYYIGTENGLTTYRHGRFKGLGNNQKESIVDSLNNVIGDTEAEVKTELVNSSGLPAGYVSAVGSSNSNKIWVMIDNALYRFDGETWTNYFEYTVAIDESSESIAEKFSIYGSDEEKENFLSKMNSLNTLSKNEVPSASPAEAAVPNEEAITNDPDSESKIKELTDKIEETKTIADMSRLNPGDVIKVPYLVGIRGKVTSIYTYLNDIWLGTDNGLIHFNGNSWSLPGYKEYVVSEGITLDTLLAGYNRLKHNPMLSENYKKSLIAINDLKDDKINTGDTILIYKNPTAAKVNFITGQSNRVYFATSDGLHMYDGQSKKLKPVTEKGMNRANSIYVRNISDQLWIASDDHIVFRVNGRNELTLMVSKWLPELAPDMYYAYASGTFDFRGWGTLGLSLTYLTYGEVKLTGEGSPEIIGTDEPYEISANVSFGTPLTKSLSGGVSAKIIYSLLSSKGELGVDGRDAGLGEGSTFGMAVDLGLLYRLNPKLNLGLAITNLGPDLQYSQEAQSDPLPRNLSLGFSYMFLNSDYNRFLVTAEVNKSLVDVGDFNEMIYNLGAEYVYANLIAPRVGYIHDKAGNVKTPTVGVGLYIMNKLRFDFSYIPSGSSEALANTLRTSLTIVY